VAVTEQADDPQPTGTRGSLVVAGLIALVMLVSILGAWFFIRQGRRTGRDTGEAASEEGEATSSAAALIAVQCSGCGKNLKAKAALAGKKVKCPQCNQGVFVPEPAPSAAAPALVRKPRRLSRGAIWLCAAAVVLLLVLL